MDSTETVEYDWENRWLTGQEYANMLNHMDEYWDSYNFEIYNYKCHPDNIYIKPANGMIYFVEGKSIGSEFGFPRVDIKKRYKWKKMNFTTDLPKKNPVVSYIVASAIRCERYFPNSNNLGPIFRMHAVILYDNPRYVLCHVRKINDNDSSMAKRKIKIPQKKFKTNQFPENAISPIVDDISGISILAQAADKITDADIMSVEITSPRWVFNPDYVSMMNNLTAIKFPEFDETPEPAFQILRH